MSRRDRRANYPLMLRYPFPIVVRPVLSLSKGIEPYIRTGLSMIGYSQ